MPIAFWDASAYSKRYTNEHGSATVNAVLGQSSLSGNLFTFAGYGETHSILRRRLNAGLLDAQDYAEARVLLRLEVTESLRFRLLNAEDQMLADIPLIERHNLNATDAAILAAFLYHRVSLPLADLPAVLVASDHRLLRAAQSEGLATLDPETVPAADVPSFLAGL